MGVAVVGDLLGLGVIGAAVGIAVVGELLGLAVGLKVGGQGASNLMLLMWINWANPF